MKKAKCIMIQGTMSNAGKSLLCTGLCRIFKQDGYKAAPFKSQNMALNSYVVKGGLEMGRAQVAQAQAAGIEPDVRMNPVLLKPSSDTGSQVIVLGEVRDQMDAMEYYRNKTKLLPEIMAAYESLAEEYDIIVIEGAGSPAEINLKENDFVNMGLAKMVNAPVLLAGDIDRGGVFAQLYGTVALLDPDEQDRIEGLIVNKFRGDKKILDPGLVMLEEKTGKPVIGVVPMIPVDIDDEDSVSGMDRETADKKPIDIAVIRLPRISNFTDFSPLENHPMMGVRYVRTVEKLGRPDLIILPGTKSTVADLLWMRQNGLEAAILKLQKAGTTVLGVCGGYQMLGMKIFDPDHVEGELDEVRGMELLPTETLFNAQKTRTRVSAEVKCGGFGGAKLDAYEIHNGVTTVSGEPFAEVGGDHFDGCVQGNVYGTYLHGLFDTGELTEKLAAYLCEEKGIDMENTEAVNHLEYLEKQYDMLADGMRASLDMERIYEIMDKYSEE